MCFGWMKSNCWARVTEGQLPVVWKSLTPICADPLGLLPETKTRTKLNHNQSARDNLSVWCMWFRVTLSRWAKTQMESPVFCIWGHHKHAITHRLLSSYFEGLKKLPPPTSMLESWTTWLPELRWSGGQLYLLIILTTCSTRASRHIPCSRMTLVRNRPNSIVCWWDSINRSDQQQQWWMVMNFRRKQQKNYTLQRIDGHTVDRLSIFMYLGVHVPETVTWYTRSLIDILTRKASSWTPQTT